MAKISGQKVYVGQFDLSAILYDLSLELGCVTQPDADWADSAAIILAGLNTASVSGKGRYTTGATGTDESLSSTNKTLVGPISLVMGTAEGDGAFVVNALQTNYTTATGGTGELHQVNFAAVPGADPVFIGRHMTTQSATSASSTSTGLELGILAAGFRLYSILHVPAGTGGNLTVTVESDVTGFAAPATDITHTVVTGPTSEVKSVAGPIATNDFRRSEWTVSAGTFTFVHIIGQVEAI